MAADDLTITKKVTRAMSEDPGPWGLAWKRFKKNKVAMMGALLLLVIVLSVLVVPLLSPHPINVIDIAKRNRGPSPEHWLGNDRLGQDNLVRLFTGGRISLVLGLMATVVATILGTLIGVFSGYYGGWIDNILMRLADIINSMPIIPFMIAINVVFIFKFPGPERMYIVMIFFGIFSWSGLARIIRGTILSMKEQLYMQAADILGVSDLSKIFRHLLPNLSGIIIVSTTFIMANAILLEVGLAFVGMGFPPPTPTWGNLIPGLRTISVVRTYPWVWVPPVLMIMLTIISINLIGEGLRDAFDPKEENH